MIICVLLPDYSSSNIDYQYYDPPRYLDDLLPEHKIDTVFLHKLTTYKQLKELSKVGYDVFVNLCEGYLEWEVPSIDVIYTLELLNLPYTGPNITLYDPPKSLMKYVSYCAGVATPNYEIIRSEIELGNLPIHLSYPLFVKPAKAGDSLGIDTNSLVVDYASLEEKATNLLKEYDELLVEKYIEGREFTVLVAANTDGKTCKSYWPIEYVFPEGTSFKTYELKTASLHPSANIPCNDAILGNALKDASEKIFVGFNGVGYARLDFRVDKNGIIYFLEINFTCSVFYSNGYEGSADYILNNDADGKRGFIQHIIREGIERHKRKQKKYIVKGNALNGYGIFAKRTIEKGEIIFEGEEKAQRIVSKSFVQNNWNEAAIDNFKRYAYPIGKDIFILWDENPAEWAPQNHHCNPNTVYKLLNVIALRKIQEGEELTLDYATFLDENMQPFECNCGASNCKRIIYGSN